MTKQRNGTNYIKSNISPLSIGRILFEFNDLHFHSTPQNTFCKQTVQKLTRPSAASGPVPHCLQMSHKTDAKFTIRVNSLSYPNSKCGPSQGSFT